MKVQEIDGDPAILGTEADEPTEQSTPSLPGWDKPVSVSSAPELPESAAYRLKRRLLGPP